MARGGLRECIGTATTVRPTGRFRSHNATPSVFHQRHIERVLRGLRGRVPAMKRSSIVYLLLFVVFALSASATGQEDRAVLTEALNNFVRAFHSFDAERTLNQYHEPLMIVAGPDVQLMPTRADTEAWMTALWTSLKERGFTRATEFSPLRVRLVSPTVAVASAQYVRYYKANGQERERNGVTYVLHKTGEAWKIVVVMDHAPGNILRLD